MDQDGAELTSVLHLNAHEEKMRKFSDVHGTDSSSTKECLPVVLDFSIKATVLDIVR